MRNRFILLLLAVIVSACSSKKEEWTKPFNGTGFEGWKVLGGEGLYEVKEGEIVGTTKGTANTFLATEIPYNDFILELEVFVDPRMNSGIQFRSAQNENGVVFGYQAEIDPSERKWSGGIYDESRRGWLYKLDFNPPAKDAFKNNQWNKYRIEAVGPFIRVWVNDICTAILDDDASSSGFIALQVHGVGSEEEEGRQVKWRNIRLMTDNPADWLRKVPKDIIKVNLLADDQ